ncbi:hypothetical protein LguiB_006499 [Lonicera macranthoides]
MSSSLASRLPATLLVEPQLPTSLFVGNLLPQVGEEQVRDFFPGADIVNIRFPQNTTGFCIVNFVTKEGAQQAFRQKNNEMLLGRKVWCNVIEPEHERENFEAHVIREDGVLVKNTNKIRKVQKKLKKKYKECGEIIDIFIPKHSICGGKGTAYIRFDTAEAIIKALNANSGAHEPEYIDNNSEIRTNGGWGGLYGYENDNGRFAYNDLKRIRGKHIVFHDSSDTD